MTKRVWRKRWRLFIKGGAFSKEFEDKKRGRQKEEEQEDRQSNISLVGGKLTTKRTRDHRTRRKRWR